MAFGGGHVRQSLASYISFFNARRPHNRLDRRTPDQVYFNQPLPLPRQLELGRYSFIEPGSTA